MATIPNSEFTGVITGNAFSQVRSIEHDADQMPNPEVLTLDSPPQITLERAGSPDTPVLGVTATAVLNGNDIDVTLDGTHSLALFDSTIQHFTRGRSNKWETAITSKSFDDVIDRNRQIFSWEPDFADKTLNVIVTYYADGQEHTTTFTQVVTPDNNVNLSDFLNNISA